MPEAVEEMLLELVLQRQQGVEGAVPALQPAIPAAQDCPPGVSASWHGLSLPWLPSRSEIPVRTNLPATLGRARGGLCPGIESSRPQPAPRLGPEPLSLHEIPSNHLPCQVSTR